MTKLKKLKRYIPLYIMLLPGLAYLIINNYMPMAGIVVAFKKFNYQLGIWGSDFIGLKNFQFLFSSPDSWLITRNTILYNLVFIVLGTAVSVGVAILMNEITAKNLKKFYMTSILLPFLISIVIVSYLVYGFLSTEVGFINKTVMPLTGGTPKSWYSTPSIWPFVLVLVNLWKYFGYNCIIYYATLVGIDRSFYEAAVIDGASRWKTVLHVTLPSLRPTIIILTLMSISKIFYSDFGLFYQVPMNSGALMDVTNTIDTYVYRSLIETHNIGMSSAAGVYQSVVGFVLILAANFAVRKYDGDSALF